MGRGLRLSLSRSKSSFFTYLPAADSLSLSTSGEWNCLCQSSRAVSAAGGRGSDAVSDRVTDLLTVGVRHKHWAARNHALDCTLQLLRETRSPRQKRLSSR